MAGVLMCEVAVAMWVDGYMIVVLNVWEYGCGQCVVTRLKKDRCIEWFVWWYELMLISFAILILEGFRRMGILPPYTSEHVRDQYTTKLFCEIYFQQV